MNQAATPAPHQRLKTPLLLRLRALPRLGRQDFALTLLPAALWPLGYALRPWMIVERCKLDPESCRQQTHWWLDAFSLNQGSRAANTSSYYTQYGAGVLLFLVAPAVSGIVLKSLNRPGSEVRRAVFVQLVMALQTTLWNGVALELTRLTVQRPRPFVFKHGDFAAQTVHHYTSFYSGHTSFAAAASVAATLSLYSVFHSLQSTAPHSARAVRATLQAVALLGLILTVATAVLRIYAGVHFATDTFAGAFAGSAIATGIALLHRR